MTLFFTFSYISRYRICLRIAYYAYMYYVCIYVPCMSHIVNYYKSFITVSGYSWKFIIQRDLGLESARISFNYGE